MTRVTKGIIISLACAIIISLFAGIAVMLSKNSLNRIKDPVSSDITAKEKIDVAKASNGKLSTFKSFDELVAALKEKGYFSKSSNSMTMYNDGITTGTATNKSVAGAASSTSSASTDIAENNTSDTESSSETNTQVAGVDEGDIVKTDGKYIYALFQNKINIINPQNPADMKIESIISNTDLSSAYNTEMYIYDKKLVVVGTYYSQSANSSNGSEILTNSTADYAYSDGSSNIFVRIYSLDNIKAPALYREFKVDGSLSATRLIDNKLYIVTAKGMNYYSEDDIKPQAVLPQYYDSTVGKDMQTISIDSVSYCPESDMNSFLNIVSFCIDNKDEANIETILGGSGTVYMTKNSLYTSYNVYNNQKTYTSSNDVISNDIATLSTNNSVIFKFDVNGLSVNFSATATIPGNLLNQFSFDEYNGYLRVATTSYSNTTNNNIYILDSSLKLTGKLEGLASGETIYSVRYSGDTGYVVTYRQTDPLFVIDLSDVTAPKVLGELKIPGFSSYMHIVGNNLVLGIGRDTKEVTSSGGSFVRTGGIKISLFDVSDKANPKELDTVVIGDNSAQCEAQYNHKALIFDSQNNMLYLPFSFVSNDLKSSKTYCGVAIKVTDNKLSEEKYFETPTNSDLYYYSSRFCYIGDTLFYIDSNSVISYKKNTYEVIGSLTLK